MQKQPHHFLHHDSGVHNARSQSQEFSLSLAPKNHNEKDQTKLYN
jgi:hypothetical protein